VTLDQIARAAVEELWTDVQREVDPPTMLTELHRARRQRRRGWLAATAAAVTVVLTVMGVTSTWVSRRPPPPAAAPLPAGEVLLVQRHATAGSGSTARLEVLGGSLPHLPRPSGLPDVRSELWGFGSLAFSPDGARLAYGDALAVGVIELSTGAKRQLRTCSYCSVAWLPSGAVLSATSGEAAFYATDLGSGRTTPVRLPSQWSVRSIDVSSTDRVLFGGTVNGVSAVMATNLEGRGAAVLATYPDAWVFDPRWSPDGQSVAFLHKDGPGPEAGAPPVEGPLEIRVMAADGGGERVLASPSTCTCTRAAPHLDWADSGRMAVVAVGGVMATRLYEVAADGSTTDLLDDTFGDTLGPIAWRSAG
jgi:hypothetical protein